MDISFRKESQKNQLLNCNLDNSIYPFANHPEINKNIFSERLFGKWYRVSLGPKSHPSTSLV